MFCPKCGNPEQSPESFCRRCGNYLPDFDKLKPAEIPPEQHITANIWLSAMTAVASLTLAIILHSIFWNLPDTPVIIYVTAGFLMAMSAWQVQVFIRTLKLKKHFERRKNSNTAAAEHPPEIAEHEVRGNLPEGNFANVAPFSVTHNTTKKLKTPRP